MNRILIMLLIAGFVLFLAGCPADTSQNNGNNYNANTTENVSDQNATTKEDISDKPGNCDPISAEKIEKEIKTFPKNLQDQFNNKTISYTFTPNTLTFKGYIQGNGKNFQALLKGFDKFRGKTCVRVVSFEGNGGNFEWRPAVPVPTPSPTPKCDVDTVIKNSTLGAQIGRNFTYTYDNKTKELEFKGNFGDDRGKNRFKKLLEDLEMLMNNTCISKIIFTAKSSKKEADLDIIGFEWQICEGGSCECKGACVPCGTCGN